LRDCAAWIVNRLRFSLLICAFAGAEGVCARAIALEVVREARLIARRLSDGTAKLTIAIVPDGRPASW
jgi:hypothetical protein